MNIRELKFSIIIRLSTLILILMCFINMNNLCVFSAVTPECFYVSQLGDDNWNGTIEQPFKTIEHARDIIRSIISAGMNSDIIVYIKGGTYNLSSTLVFDNRDSGNNGYKVTYKNFAQENVILSGSKPISGWQAYSGNIYRLNVGTSSTANRLYEGETQGSLARYPNTGYNRAVGVIDTGTGLPSKTKFAFNPGDITSLTQTSSLQVYIWSGGPSGDRDWNPNTINVTNVDYVNHTITLATPTYYEIGTGSRYFIQKSLDLLDSPGESYLDQQAGMLYYLPQKLPIEENNILIPKAGDIVQFKGASQNSLVSNISMEGINISYSDIGCNGVLMSYASGITLKNCIVSNVGGNGVKLATWSQNNTIYGNHIYNVGIDGVKIESPNSITSVGVANNTVSNNYIHDTSLIVGDGSGISLYQSDGNTISYNRVRNTKSTAIQLSGVPEHFAIGTYMGGVLITQDNVDDIRHCRNNIVEYNDVSEANLDRQDTGLIYSWGSLGNTISNNKLHNSYIPFGHGYGLYLDDESDDFTVSNNLIYDLQNNLPTGCTGSLYAPIYIKGRRNIVTNNVAANNNASKGAISSFQMDSFVNRDLQIMNNILYNNGSNAYHFASWSEDRFAVANNNVFYDASGYYNISGCALANNWTEWKTILNKKYDQNSVTGDPQFINASANDYRLKYNSPAYAIGKKDINYKDMGLKQDYIYSNSTDNLGEIFVKQINASADSGNINILLNETTQLEVSGRTATGFQIDLADASVTYSSDNANIATVDHTGLVSSVGKGIAKISATMTINGVSKSKDIYINVVSNSATSWYFCDIYGNEIQKPQNSKFMCMLVRIDKSLSIGLPIKIRLEVVDQNGLVVAALDTTKSFGVKNSIDIRFGFELPDLYKKYYLKLYSGDVGGGMILLNTVSLIDNVLVMPVGSNLLFSDTDRVAFIGDSVTAFGNTPNYLKLIYDFYLTRYPEKKMSFSNLGVGGYSLSDAIAYENYEIVPVQPTKAVITMGMNDVNRSIWSDANPTESILSQRQSAINNYRNNYEKLIADLKAKNIDLMLATPSIYDQTMMPNGSQYGANDGLVLLSGVVNELGQKYNLPVVKYNEPMLEINKNYQLDNETNTIIGSDRIHPQALGHAIMGYLFLKQTGATSEVATVEIDKSTSSVLKASNCSIANLSTTNDTVTFDYTPNSLPLPISAEYKDADKLVALTQDLNMETFKITGLPQGNYSVSMDNEFVEQYTSEALAKGVNLAVEQYNPGQRAASNISQINLQREFEETKLRTIRFMEKTTPIVTSFCTSADNGEWIANPNYNTTQQYSSLSSTDKATVDNYMLLKLNVTAIKANIQTNIDAMYTAAKSSIRLHSVKIAPSSGVMNLLVNDNFDYSLVGYAPGGWTFGGVPTGGSVSAEEIPSATNKSMKIHQNSSTTNVKAYKSFDKQSGENITIQFKAMAEQNNKWVNMSVQSSSLGNAFTIAFGQSGVFRYTNGSTWAVGPTYSFGTFYDIKIVANTATYKYDLYIGGVNVASNIDFYSQQPDIQNIYFGTTAPLSTVYFDTVQVSKN